MADIHSTVTELPLSCKSAAERTVKELEREDVYANLTEDCCSQLTELEQSLSEKTGENIALVAYRV